MKIHVAITTCERLDMLTSLLDDIRREGTRHDIRIYVYDDHSSDPLDSPDDHGVTEYKYMGYRHGKRNFWRIVSMALSKAIVSEWDYFFMMPDDVRLEGGFFDEAIALWESIEDPSKRAMNLLQDEQRRGRAAWTGFTPIICHTTIGPVYKSQWTEHALMCERSFFDIVSSIRQPDFHRWNRRNVSSGVGEHISHQIHGAGYSIYQVYNTLLHHGNHASVMHPGHRESTPLTTK